MRKMKYVALFAVALILAVGAFVQFAPAGYLTGTSGEWITNLSGLNIYPQASGQTTAFRVEDTSGNDVVDVSPAGAITLRAEGTLTLDDGDGTDIFTMTSGGVASGFTVAMPLVRHIEAWNSATRSGDVYFYLPDNQTSYTAQRIEVMVGSTQHGAEVKLQVWQSGNFPATDSKDLITCTAPVTHCEDETFTWFDTLTGGRSIHVRIAAGSVVDEADVYLWVHKTVGTSANRY